jgi:hypothetical protein
MPEIPLFPLDLPPLPGRDRTPDDDVRQKRRAADWRSQITRAYAYNYGRARSDADREALDAAYEQAMGDKPDFARVHRNSDFMEPPKRPFNAKEAQEIMRQARAIERGTYANREKGAHGGAIGKSALRVLETLLFVMWPTARRGIYPSLEHIAARAQLSRRTVQTAIAVLKLFGFLQVFRRIKRVATVLGSIFAQDTNAYLIQLPSGLGALGAAIFAARPEGKVFQAKESIFNLYGFSPANAAPHLRE